MRNLSTAPAALPLPLAGSSEAAVRAREAFGLALSRRGPVLIVAEDGSRAGDVARALHDSGAAPGPFLTLDCAALEPVRIGAVLFGDAEPDEAQDLLVVGPEALLLAAAGGTLYIDSIDDLPASAQRRLVRVLRDGEVRIAAGRAATMAWRLVASASRPLDAEVREGRFRQDLYRRLADGAIGVPPLRQRAGDIPAIVEALTAGAEPLPSFTQAALTVLGALPWPRNIDELGEVLARIAQSAGPVVRQEDVLAHLPISGTFARQDLTASLRDARRRFEREYIEAVLEHHQWRMSDAARTLGIERANLYRKARQLGISRAPRPEAS